MTMNPTPILAIDYSALLYFDRLIAELRLRELHIIDSFLRTTVTPRGMDPNAPLRITADLRPLLGAGFSFHVSASDFRKRLKVIRRVIRRRHNPVDPVTLSLREQKGVVYYVIHVDTGMKLFLIKLPKPEQVMATLQTAGKIALCDAVRPDPTALQNLRVVCHHQQVAAVNLCLGGGRLLGAFAQRELFLATFPYAQKDFDVAAIRQADFMLSTPFLAWVKPKTTTIQSLQIFRFPHEARQHWLVAKLSLGKGTPEIMAVQPVTLLANQYHPLAETALDAQLAKVLQAA